MSISGDIVLYKKGEASLFPKDNRSTTKIKIRIGDPLLAEDKGRGNELPRDEDMVNLINLESSNPGKEQAWMQKERGEKKPDISGIGKISFRDKLTNTINSANMTKDF